MRFSDAVGPLLNDSGFPEADAAAKAVSLVLIDLAFARSDQDPNTRLASTDVFCKLLASIGGKQWAPEQRFSAGALLVVTLGV
jgi:hypothetical protein